MDSSIYQKTNFCMKIIKILTNSTHAEILSNEICVSCWLKKTKPKQPTLRWISIWFFKEDKGGNKHIGKIHSKILGIFFFFCNSSDISSISFSEVCPWILSQPVRHVTELPLTNINCINIQPCLLMRYATHFRSEFTSVTETWFIPAADYHKTTDNWKCWIMQVN